MTADASFAALSIEIEITDDASLFTLKHFLGETLVIEGCLTKSSLKEQVDSLREDLFSFKEAIGNELPVENSEAFSWAINRLHRCGQVLAWQLFNFLQHNSESVRVLLNKASLLARRPILVELDARVRDLLPIEFFPLFNMADPPESMDVTNIRDVAGVLARFLGFSAIIKRSIRGIKPIIGTKLKNTPKLPVKFFHDARFEGAKQELEFFQEHTEFVDLDGPWPDRELDPKQFGSNVAEYLWNPAVRFSGCKGAFGDQVQHFACHCNTTDGNSLNFFLSMAHSEGSECSVSIKDLLSRFANLAATNVDKADGILPLVFFNACGSSVIYPTCATSFPELILRNGNRGFIGTQTSIPDKFAAAFSKQFYIALLQGHSVGSALHKAKWQLIERHRNPLGILYTLYGDPDISVENILYQ